MSEFVLSDMTRKKLIACIHEHELRDRDNFDLIAELRAKLAAVEGENETLADRLEIRGDFNGSEDNIDRLEAKLAAAETQSNIDRDTIEGAKEYIRALEKECDGYREIAEEAAELGKSQAAEFDAEVEKLEAHNAVLRGALEKAKKLWGLGIEYGYSQGCHLENKRVVSDGEDLLNDICKALSETPSDSAERVKRLVDALELMVDTIDDQLGGGGWVPEFEVEIDEKLEPWASIFDAQDKAQKALAEWRGKK